MVLINAPTQDQWNRLLKVMGREELVTDPRFNTPLRRQDPASAVAIESLVGDWMRSLSVDEAYRALVAADVPAAPVRTIDQVAADPQVEHRRMVQGVRHPQSGLEMRLTGNPVKLSGLRGRDRPPGGARRAQLRDLRKVARARRGRDRRPDAPQDHLRPRGRRRREPPRADRREWRR